MPRRLPYDNTLNGFSLGADYLNRELVRNKFKLRPLNRNFSDSIYALSAIQELAAGTSLNKRGPNYGENLSGHVMTSHISSSSLNMGSWVDPTLVGYAPEDYRRNFNAFTQGLFRKVLSKIQSDTMPPNISVNKKLAGDRNAYTINIPFTNTDFTSAIEELPTAAREQVNGFLGGRTLQNIKIFMEKRGTPQELHTAKDLKRMTPRDIDRETERMTPADKDRYIQNRDRRIEKNYWRIFSYMPEF